MSTADFLNEYGVLPEDSNVLREAAQIITAAATDAAFSIFLNQISNAIPDAQARTRFFESMAVQIQTRLNAPQSHEEYAAWVNLYFHPSFDCFVSELSREIPHHRRKSC